ncbi:MAG: hypothetical protein JWM11_7407 [Planctomycetaceae bacterium]|nr:hypothetical protein [Planctomycetaceae bacterium]
MTIRTFLERLQNKQVNNLIYSANGLAGLISVWKHEESFVLTWEECPSGEQYDESLYTRNERLVFWSIDEILGFLATNDLKAESFTP